MTSNTQCRTKHRLLVSALIALGGFAAAFSGYAQSTYQPPGNVPDSSAKPAGDEVVTLDKFTVSTALGHYSEVTSSAANKMPTQVKDVPFTLQVFNSSLITDHVAKTLDDLYLYIVGISRESHDATGFNIRGFTATSADSLQQLQMDGLPGPAVKFGSPPTYNVERVEVVKGPTSLLYGRMPPGGMVNIVSKNPLLTPVTTIQTTLTTFEAPELSTFGHDAGITTTIDTTGPIDQGKHWLYRLVAVGDYTNDYRKGDFSHAFYIYPSFEYRWSNTTSFTVRMEFVHEVRRADDYLPFPPLLDTHNIATYNVVYQEPSDKTRDAGNVLATTFKHVFADDWNLTVNTRLVSHWDTGQEFRTNQVDFPVIAATPIENSRLQRFYQRKLTTRGFDYVDANIWREFHQGAVTQSLLLGATGGEQHSDVMFFSNASSGPSVSLVNLFNPVLGQTPYPPDGVFFNRSEPIIKYFDMGYYATDTVKYKNLHVTLGGRYDVRQGLFQNPYLTTPHRNVTTHAGVPMGGLLYNITDQVSAYASFAKTFRPQAINAQVDANGIADLPAETGTQYEVGLKADSGNGKFSGTLSVYQITKNNVLEATGINAPNGQPIGQLVGEQQSKGTEIDTIYLPIPNWQIEFGGTVMEAHVTQSAVASQVGRALINVPHHSWHVWTRYNFPAGKFAGWGLGLGIINQGARAGGSTVNQTGGFVLPEYVRFDTGIYYSRKNTTVSLNVSNLFDKRYLASTGNSAIFPGEPRKLALNIKFKF